MKKRVLSLEFGKKVYDYLGKHPGFYRFIRKTDVEKVLTNHGAYAPRPIPGAHGSRFTGGFSCRESGVLRNSREEHHNTDYYYIGAYVSGQGASIP